VSLLGSGGMGEVYRARDPKLIREVAVKLLPESVAQDLNRLARFRRKAQVLAALNHPHIAQVFGFEESDGICALVMELEMGRRSRSASHSSNATSASSATSGMGESGRPDPIATRTHSLD
jgi:serine/threonine protein kinase